jgi:2-dehydropantoate 2-reductase
LRDSSVIEVRDLRRSSQPTTMTALPRSVLFKGAGATGGVLAAALYAAGWRVRLRVRDGTLQDYAGHGLRISGAAGEAWLPPECFGSNHSEPFDLVVLAVKTPDLAAALRRAASDDDGARLYLTLQNGLDAPAQVAAAFGAPRVLAGAAVINAHLDLAPDGARTVRMASALRKLTLAPLAPAQWPRAQSVAQALTVAGIDAAAQPDPAALLWHKFLGLEPLATVCALTGHTLGALRENGAALGLLRGLFGETAALGRAQRTVDDAQVAARWQSYLNGPAAMRPSLAVDLARGLPAERTELAALTGAVLEHAARFGVAVPLHHAAYRALARTPRATAANVADLLAGTTAAASSSAPESHSTREPAMPDALLPSAARLTVRALRPQDIAAVDALRIAGYGRATWFTLTDGERIRCARDAAGSRVTVVFDGERVVATLCQTPVADRDAAEALLELEAPVSEDDFPALVISRAATAEGYTGLRLNHLLRWYTLKAAAAGGIRSILGGHARGTPNLRVMGELGYQFRETSASSMSQVKVNTQHVMSYLPAQDFAATQVRLLPLIKSALAQSAWDGAELDVRLSAEPTEIASR